MTGMHQMFLLELEFFSERGSCGTVALATTGNWTEIHVSLILGIEV